MSAALPAHRSGVVTVLRVVSGNFLEMFDFFLFGFYATNIARAFFPAGSDFAALMLTFMTFGAGFLMRPLGAIILGAYVDRIGRRKGLIVTLTIMACGTLLIAFVPGYETIGLAAPLLVLIGRLLQGFSAGVELGGVSVYLSEMATPGNKGFYVAWQSASQQVAIMVAAVIGWALSTWLTPPQIGAWGWRIPFVIGCLIVPFLFYIRRSLEETQEFLARRHHPSTREIFASIGRNWAIVLLGMMLVVMTTVSFYAITVYTPTFGKSVLKLTTTDSLIVTFCVGLSNFIWLPVMGALSDRVGRKPILMLFSGLTLLTAYPALVWLVAAPSFANMLVGAAVAVLPVRQLQRRDGGGSDGDRARYRPHRRIFPGVCAGDGAVRRLYAAGFHLADRGNRQPGRTGPVDGICRFLRARRNPADIQQPSGSGPRRA
jgi:MFS transporter, MHS family, citrate/tricarballylate:H+ symporter